MVLPRGCVLFFATPSIIPLVVAESASSTFKTKCLQFAPEHHIHNSTLTNLEFVPANTTLLFPDNVSSCARPRQLVFVDLCRMSLSIPTSERSSITFELWLPATWESRRFLGTGNGGTDGCVKYEDLAYGTSNGFATFGTNNGHNGTTGVAFLNNPEIFEDFAYRSLHTGTVYGKLLTQKFYDSHLYKSYYLGCSLGGRQGIKAAEKYPEDFDGIVAGSPAVDFNNLNSWRAHFYPITGANISADFITADMWIDLIHNEILNQCDTIDGVKDGIIEVPSLCDFKPERIQCSRLLTTNCLSSAQILQVKQIFSTYAYPNGLSIFPRMQYGSEIMAVSKLYAGAPFSYSLDYFRDEIYSNTTWDPATFSTKDAAVAEEKDPSHIRTYPSTLPEFKKRGGKLLSFHGGQDQQITSFNTERFYDHMLHADSELHDYYRFFRISGMFHCNAGPGAWVVGQGGAASAAGIPFNASQNVLAAMVAWVEEGVAPLNLTGTKFANDTVGEGIAFQRTHCLYPLQNTYIGGDYKQPSSWRCEKV